MPYNPAYDYADSHCRRYGYDHLTDINMMKMDMIMLIVSVVDMIIRLIINMIDMDMIIKLIINVVDMNVIIGLMISMVDAGVIKQIMKDIGSIDALVAIKGNIFMVIVATYIVNTFGEIIRTTLTHTSQNKTNSLEGVA